MVFGAIVTLATLVPAEVGIKANLLGQALEGIKPEWYFLFMFQTLKHVPETVGVLFFALGAVFLLLVPFLDRRALREEKSPGFTAVFVLLAIYVAVFQIWAAASPGVDHASADTASASASMAGNLFMLAMMWMVIGFLVFYLRQLLKENKRIRELYR